MDIPEQSVTESRRRVRFLPRFPSPALASYRASSRVAFLSPPIDGPERSGRFAPISQPVDCRPPHAYAACAPEFSFRGRSADLVTVTATTEVCRRLRAHCVESNRHGREVAGILVGYRDYRKEPGGRIACTVLWTDIIPVPATDCSPVHITLDRQCWEHVDEQMNRSYAPAGKCRLGWYHTHPTQGIFFSGRDRDAHTIFRQPHQFAIVVDPRAADAAVFYWCDYASGELGGPIHVPLEPDCRPGSTGRGDADSGKRPGGLADCGIIGPLVSACRKAFAPAHHAATVSTPAVRVRFLAPPVRMGKPECQGPHRLPPK